LLAAKNSLHNLARKAKMMDLGVPAGNCKLIGFALFEMSCPCGVMAMNSPPPSLNEPKSHP
jgi:hypothetical protein